MGNDPDILVPLTTARTEFEAATMAESLKAEGIPAEVFSTAANTLQWQVTFTDPIKVMVRRSDVDKARQVLRAVRADSVDIDWADVDVGSPEQGSVAAPPRLGPRGLTSRMRRVRAVGWALLFTSMAMIAFDPTRMSGMIAAVLLGSLLAWSMMGKAAPKRGFPPVTRHPTRR